jgi:hypothetical protein
MASAPCRQGADAGNDQRRAFDLHAHRLGRHAGEGGDDPNLPLGLEHIHGRLPAGAFARGLEELALELLGLLDEGAGLGPHLMFRVTHHANLN